MEDLGLELALHLNQAICSQQKNLDDQMAVAFILVSLSLLFYFFLVNLLHLSMLSFVDDITYNVFFFLKLHQC